MNRRDFLRALPAVAAIPLIPVLLRPTKDDGPWHLDGTRCTRDCMQHYFSNRRGTHNYFIDTAELTEKAVEDMVIDLSDRATERGIRVSVNPTHIRYDV